MRKIIYNGVIWPQKNKSLCEAIVIDDDRIAFVGSNEDAFQYQTEESWMLDLNGAFAMPGFNDSHLHLYGSALTKSQLMLFGVASHEELIESTKAYIQDRGIPNGKWVVGRGWNQDLFKEGPVFPTKHDLDRISSVHPIVLNRVCGHVMVANSLALKKSGIESTTKCPSGGTLDFETGTLTEHALGLVYKAIPDPSEDELENLLVSGMEYAASKGVTTLQTDDLNHLSQSGFERMLSIYERLEQEGKLKTRIRIQAQLPDEKTLKRFLDQNHHKKKRGTMLKIGPVKLLTDGTLGAKTAAMRSPYADDPLTKGFMTYSPETLNHLVEMAHNASMNVALHAIGDEAISRCLDAIENALIKKPNLDHRHAIVHCQITDEAILNRFKALGVTAIVQPIFIDYDMHIVESRVGAQLASTSYAFGTMVQKGIRVAIGTDAPIEDLDPLPNVQAAVTRKDKSGYPPNGFHPEEKMSVEDALDRYTKTCAESTFDETILGSLEEGKLADFIVLDQNLLEIDPDQIKSANVLVTFLGGQIIHPVSSINRIFDKSKEISK